MNGGGSICSVTRYAEGTKKRILNAAGRNWLHGHWNGHAGVAYYNGWVTSSNGIVTPDTDWVLMCSDGSAKVLVYSTAGVLDASTGHTHSSAGITALYRGVVGVG